MVALRSTHFFSFLSYDPVLSMQSVITTIFLCLIDSGSEEGTEPPAIIAIFVLYSLYLNHLLVLIKFKTHKEVESYSLKPNIMIL